MKYLKIMLVLFILLGQATIANSIELKDKYVCKSIILSSPDNVVNQANVNSSIQPKQMSALKKFNTQCNVNVGLKSGVSSSIDDIEPIKKEEAYLKQQVSKEEK